MEGARKKFTEWGVIDQGFHRVAGGIVKPETGWTMPRRTWMSGLGLFSKNISREVRIAQRRGLVHRGCLFGT